MKSHKCIPKKILIFKNQYDWIRWTGSLESIEPFGIEPDFSSLGIEPADVLGFQSEDEMENAIKLLTMDIKHSKVMMLEL